MEQKSEMREKAFELLGGKEGCRALAETFYGIMENLPEAGRIRAMHPDDLRPTCEKFTLFLCGWLGGPPLYREKIGPLDLTGLHALLQINKDDRDMWLFCMQKAIAEQPVDDEFKAYLLNRFRTPAEKIYNWCQQQLIQGPGVVGLQKI